MPTVSVVIPTYNREATLPCAIESVLAQTFEDFELLVIDDDSTDDTADVVDRFDDARIRYLSHGRNEGGSAARNTGIERATGTYIAFLDSDDEWLPTKLERQVDRLESRPAEWVAVYCGYHVQRHGTTRTLRTLLRKVIGSASTRHGKEGGRELIRDVLMIQLPTGGASTLMVRADALDEIDGFDETFERHQDWEFLIRLLRVGKLAYVNEKLMVKHETAPPPTAAVERTKRKYFETFEAEIERTEAAGNDVTGQHRFDLARRYFREGEFRKGIAYLDRVAIRRQRMPTLTRCVIEGLLRSTRGVVTERL